MVIPAGELQMNVPDVATVIGPVNVRGSSSLNTELESMDMEDGSKTVEVEPNRMLRREGLQCYAIERICELLWVVFQNTGSFTHQWRHGQVQDLTQCVMKLLAE